MIKVGDIVRLLCMSPNSPSEFVRVDDIATDQKGNPVAYKVYKKHVISDAWFIADEVAFHKRSKVDYEEDYVPSRNEVGSTDDD